MTKLADNFTMRKHILILIILLIQSTAFSAETCSRIAVVNKQEVLVDPSSNSPGEGLKSFLEKDQEANQIFAEYQEGYRPSWKKSFLSTIGAASILTGLFVSNDNSGFFNKSNLFITGGALILTGYFINLSFEYANEKKFTKAINEYNKRNEPKIYLLPSWSNKGVGVSLGVNQGF